MAENGVIFSDGVESDFLNYSRRDGDHFRRGSSGAACALGMRLRSPWQEWRGPRSERDARYDRQSGALPHQGQRTMFLGSAADKLPALHQCRCVQHEE
jgi:hypothetical protein